MFNFTPILAQPKLNDVFDSIKTSTQGTEVDNSRIIGLMLLVIAFALAYTAVKHWNKRGNRSRVLHHHGKLLREACGRSGLSKAKLKKIAELSETQGLSSPLVAAICPSVLRKLAANAKTDKDRRALADVARELVNHQG
jgi:hypothetical protein